MNMHAPRSDTVDATPFDATPFDRVVVPVAARRAWVRPTAIAAVLAGLAALIWALFGPDNQVQPQAVAQIPTVSVIVPGTTQVADTITVTGSIAARRDAAVGINGEGGMVTAVLVDAGQSVRRGQLLARIDSSVQAQQVASMAASIKQARADAALSQAELDRANRLVDKGFISRADIDKKTATRDGDLAKVAVAQAQLGEMQARMARLDLRSPSNGLVLARSIETGQIVGPSSSSLFRIAEDGVLEMRALVAEQDMARLKVGLPANVRPVGSSTDYPGKIWLLDPVIDNVSRQGVARIALAYSPGLRVGAFANATIAAGTARQPVVPQSAVQVDGATSFVYVVGDGNVVVKRPVKVGQVTADGLGIARGLVGTERIVVSAGAFLQPGEKVAPVPQAAPASPAATR
ncbi:MAG: efflux RND transporter periplasmic adaptor subunit [Janthinobacterium lividum]